jgi:hypothetical protein
MNRLPDFCHECGHYSKTTPLNGLCWVGSEDNGPDSVMKYDSCEEHTREAFEKLQVSPDPSNPNLCRASGQGTAS